MRQLLNDSFMQAIVQANVHSVRQFLASGFDVNSNNPTEKRSFSRLPDDNSYLHWAVMYANEPIVRLLLENGADVNSTNKFGATPLHEAVSRKSTNKKDTLLIIETLLIYKSDPLHIKASSGPCKDMNALELAYSRFQNDPDVYNLIKDFLSDVSSTTSSLPNSPLSKIPNDGSPQHAGLFRQSSVNSNSSSNTIQNNIIHSIDNIAAQKGDSPGSSKSKSSHESEHLQNWCSSNDGSESDSPSLESLLWPPPQYFTIINDKEGFDLSTVKTEPVYIYFKPPYTYTHMDLVNKLASSFSGMNFFCIHKPIAEPHISVTIDKTLFQHENQYSILVTQSKVSIIARGFVV